MVAANADATGAEDPAAQVARDHLAAELGAEDVTSAVVTDQYASQHNGVTHVYLRQTIAGLEVLGADATVSVRDGEALHADHRLIDGLAGLGVDAEQGDPQSKADGSDGFQSHPACWGDSTTSARQPGVPGCRFATLRDAT